MKVITRDWIRDDCIMYASNNQTYSKHQLINIIDYCKEKMIEAGAKKGDKIGISLIGIDIFYTASLFAAFELGLKLTIIHRMNNQEETLKPKSLAHMPLDIYICYTLDDYTQTYITTNFYKNNSRIIIETNKQWNLRDALVPRSTPTWCKPDDVLLLCNSSGTTGNPKLVSHDHRFFYDLSTFNAKFLDITEDDTILHMSSVNHGAPLFLSYIPGLRVCKRNFLDLHKIVTDSYSKTLMRSCYENKITSVFSPNSVVTDSIIDAIDADDTGMPETKMIVVSFINPRWLKVIKQGKLKKIVSAFGCSEAGGPIFVPSVDKNTNVETFDPKFLGKPTTGFYKVSTTDDVLTVDLPSGLRVITEDIVEQTSDGFYFKRKNKLRKISDFDINPIDIIEKVEQYCSRNRFEVVVDEIYNQLYIVTNSKKLLEYTDQVKKIIAKIYPPEVSLTDIVYMKDFESATVAVKPDREKLLDFVDRVRRSNGASN